MGFPPLPPGDGPWGVSSPACRRGKLNGTRTDLSRNKHPRFLIANRLRIKNDEDIEHRTPPNESLQSPTGHHRHLRPGIDDEVTYIPSCADEVTLPETGETH